MKIYALQVDPEIQESPLFFEEDFFPENINVFGKRNNNKSPAPEVTRAKPSKEWRKR